MSDLKPCPCGSTPKEIYIEAGHKHQKWKRVLGYDCCSDWGIEFRDDYPCNPVTTQERAIKAWNEAPRPNE